MNGAVEVLDQTADLADLAPLATLVEAVLEAEGRKGRLSLVLVSEATMTDLNVRYRGGDGPTDVLAFAEEPGSPWPEVEQAVDGSGVPGGAGPTDTVPFLGEVIVCVAVVRRYAREEGATADRQLGWTIIHGTLHLLGYDHEQDQGEMRGRERVLLERFAGLLLDLGLGVDL